MIYPGNWPDACAHPDGLAFVTLEDSVVVARINGVTIWRRATPETLMFQRCGMVDGHLVSVSQGHDSGHAWVVIDGAPPADFGLTFGVQPVAVGPAGVYIVRNGSRIEVVSLAGVVVRTILGPGSSQGIRDVTPDGDLRMSDDWFTRTVAGITLIQPSERGDMIVGQLDRAPLQIAGVFDGTQVFTAILAAAYEPHVCQTTQGYAVCARTPQGAALAILPPYPAFVSSPAPVPEPPPMPAQYPWLIAPFPGLDSQVFAALTAARSIDDIGYWVTTIKAATNGDDWPYWVGRIDIGDGAGKVPGPTPAPPTPVPPVDGLTLDGWVNSEIDQIHAAYVAKHGLEPSWHDFAFQSWRRLREGWTLARLLSEI